MKYNYNQKWRYERKLRGLPNNLKRILIDSDKSNFYSEKNKF